MKSKTFYCILYFLTAIFLKLYLCRGEINTTLKFQYNLTTILLKSMSLSHPFSKKLLPGLTLGEQDVVKEYLELVKLRPKKLKIPKLMTNLYSILKHFFNDNCLVVVNSFEGADILPTIDFPLILRQFDLAIGHVEYIDPRNNKSAFETGTLWIPKKQISQLNGSFYTDEPNKHFFAWEKNCLIFKFLYSIWPADKDSANCLGPNSINYIVSSKPWQCEIQVELFMPDNLLRYGKYTQMFDNLAVFGLRTVPSLRQPVHILVDTKVDASEYDWVSLVAWTSRRNARFYQENTKSYVVNHLQVTGQASCSTNCQEIYFHLECEIRSFNEIFICPECEYLVSVHNLKREYFHLFILLFWKKSRRSLRFQEG